MRNKEKFNNLISREKANSVSINRDRIKNRARLRESQDIALKVLSKLDELNWSQRKLASELKVSPQQVSKIIKGKENLTLETVVKLQQVLDIPILASFYENKIQAFSFDEFLKSDISQQIENISSGISFYKKEFIKGFNVEPKMVSVKEYRYQMAS